MAEYERAVILTNPHSTQAKQRHARLFLDSHPSAVRIQTVNGNTDDNADAIAAALRPHDRLVVCGGDGTGHEAANAVLRAGREGDVQLGFFPAGNFCDQAAAFSGRSAYQLLDRDATSLDLVYPLELSVNDEHHRYGLLYASLGWTAHAAALFDCSKRRSKLQRYAPMRRLGSLAHLAGHYLASRRSPGESSLPPYRLNDGPARQSTDIAYLNSPIAASLVRSNVEFYRDITFGRTELNVMQPSRHRQFILGATANYLLGIHRPLADTMCSEDTVSFTEPSPVALQIDGETTELPDQSRVTVAKRRDLSLLVVRPMAKTLSLYK